jgi:hypothetical protein
LKADVLAELRNHQELELPVLGKSVDLKTLAHADWIVHPVTSHVTLSLCGINAHATPYWQLLQLHGRRDLSRS